MHAQPHTHTHTNARTHLRDNCLSVTNPTHLSPHVCTHTLNLKYVAMYVLYEILQCADIENKNLRLFKQQ